MKRLSICRRCNLGIGLSMLPLMLIAGELVRAEDAVLEKGKALYNGNGACATCHGATGVGDGAAAAALPVKPRSFVTGEFNYDTDGDGKKGTESDILNIITDGAAKYGGSPMMVARPDLPEDDRKALAKYVLSLKQK